MICPFRARDFMGDDTQAVGAGLALRRALGAGRAGKAALAIPPLGI